MNAAPARLVMLSSLRHIEAKACPECGTTDVLAVEFRNCQTPEKYSESVEFCCYHKLRYVGSFGRVEQVETCTKSPQAANWKELRALLAKVMVEAIKPHAAKPGVDLDPFERSLRRDLDLYRDDLEQSAELVRSSLHAPTSWLDMTSAPRDSTLVLLLVRFTNHPTADAQVAVTIGGNNLDNDGQDLWQFAGWCWEHDHFVDGEGEPIGWLPLPGLGAADGHPDDAAIERFSLAMKAKMARGREKGRGGWEDTSTTAETLADLFVSHIPKGNAGNFEDLANLAMMMHHRGDDPKVLADALRGSLEASIGTPETVYANMKAGSIPKPTLRSMVDLYGEVVNGEGVMPR